MKSLHGQFDYHKGMSQFESTVVMNIAFYVKHNLRHQPIYDSLYQTVLEGTLTIAMERRHEKT